MLKMAHVLKKLWHRHRISAVKALKHCIMPYSALSVSIPAMQHLEEQHPLCWRFFPPLSLWRWLLCQALCCLFVESKEIDFFFFFSIPSAMDVIYSGTRGLEGKFLGIHSMHMLKQCMKCEVFAAQTQTNPVIDQKQAAGQVHPRLIWFTMQFLFLCI